MKNILIIGGTSGIGLAASRFLADSGHTIFSTYNSNEKLDSIENVSRFRLNVLEDELDFSWLPDQLDGLVYCPGAVNVGPFNRLSPQSFREDFELQVIGAIKVIQAVLARLQKSDQSSIVLFSSVAASLGFNFHSQVSTSKSALEGLAVSLAAEFAPKIRVNIIAPSITHTPLTEKFLNSAEKVRNNEKRHPLQTIGQAEDIAKSVGFLLSDDSSWVTGQVLSVDGGLSKIKL